MAGWLFSIWPRSTHVHHGISRGCKEVSALVLVASPSHGVLLIGLFLTFFHASLPGSVWPFLTYVFSEVAPSWLSCLTVPCGGTIGTSVYSTGQLQPLLTEATLWSPAANS